MRNLKQFRNLAILALSILVGSCNRSGKDPRQTAAGQVKEYPVISVKPQSTRLYKDYPTKLQGQQTVEIRSRIAGYIEKIYVDEGAQVKKGQVLFRLNDNDLQATVRSAEAQVKVAEADLNTAKIDLEKTQPLVEKNIISKFDLASVEAAQHAKEAQLAQAQANLQNAKANLQYSLITSPADGTIGTFPYRVGSLVSSTSSDPLTTVSNTQNMYAYFAFDERAFLSMIEGLEGKNLQEKFKKLPDVTLILADNTVYPLPGRLETASGLIDTETGSVNVRAGFPNPEGILRSGGSGFVRIPQEIDSALIIPQKTTFELQNKHFVYLVNDSNKVQATEIGVLVGNLKDSYVVTSGLKAGDQIVLEGISALRNDTEIKPKLTEVGSLSENMQASGETKN